MVATDFLIEQCAYDAMQLKPRAKLTPTFFSVHSIAVSAVNWLFTMGKYHTAICQY
jgi:hypothetical protein